MSFEWKEVSVEEVIDINPTYTLKKGALAKKVAMEDLAPFTKSINDYQVEEYKGGVKFKNGDTLVARITPSLENGKTAFVNILDNNEIGFGSTEFIVLRGKEGKTENEFVYYLSVSPEFRSVAIKSMTGTSGRQRAQVDAIGKWKFMLPPPQEQLEIARLLSSLDDKIELNNAINKNLEEMAQALFKRWFVDFEFPNEKGEPYKSSGGEFEESELGLIPKGWRVGTLSELCDVNVDTYSGKENWEFINYLDTGSITKNQINEIQMLNYKEDKIPSRAKRKIKPNDLVYSTVRPNQHHYGIIKEPVENMLASTGFVVLTSKGVISNDLVYLWLTQNEITQKLQSIAEDSTSTYPSIKPSDILSIKIVIPSVDDVNKLASIIETQHNQIWKNQQQNRILTQLLDTLLPKLMSGEIRVPVEQP